MIPLEGPYKCCCQHHPTSIECPDKKPGCAVLHYRADGCNKDAYRLPSEVVPICDDCKECPK